MQRLVDLNGFQLDYVEPGIIVANDTNDFLQAFIVNGPAGFQPGDNFKVFFPLPELPKASIPFKQQVIFWLSRRLPQEGKTSSRNSGGDSLFNVQGNNKLFKIIMRNKDKEDTQVFLFLNEFNRLSGIGCQLTEAKAILAERHAYMLLNSMLDRLSFKYRTPCIIERVEVIDLSSDTPMYYLTLNQPYNGVVIDPDKDFQEPIALRENIPWGRALAFYREALLLPIPMYRYLALCKAIEDIDRAKTELFQKFKVLGIKLEMPEVKLCNTGFLAQHFKELVNMPISKTVKFLEAKYRNIVAHPILTDGSYVHSDSRRSTVDYSNLCGLADYCFRLKVETLIHVTTNYSKQNGI